MKVRTRIARTRVGGLPRSRGLMQMASVRLERSGGGAPRTRVEAHASMLRWLGHLPLPRPLLHVVSLAHLASGGSASDAMTGGCELASA